MFTIHKQLLCDVSPYFEAALNGTFQEAKEQRISFPEDVVAVFEQFQAWLYFRTPLPNIDIMDAPSAYNEWNVLVHLYVLADKFQIPTLQNAAIHGIIEGKCNTNQLQITLIPLVYQKTTTGSQLRKLFVDIFVHMSHTQDKSKWFNPGYLKFYTQEFLFHVAEALCKSKEGKIEKIRDFRAVRAEYYIEV